VPAAVDPVAENAAARIVLGGVEVPPYPPGEEAPLAARLRPEGTSDSGGKQLQLAGGKLRVLLSNLSDGTLARPPAPLLERTAGRSAGEWCEKAAARDIGASSPCICW